MRRAMLAITLVALPTGCIPDETGYLDGRGGDTPAVSTDIPEADEAADADDGAPPDSVYYTAPVVLGPDPGEVVVIGLAGTLLGADGQALVIGRPGSEVDLTVVDGGFVVQLVAALGDVVRVREGGVVAFELPLDDDLSDVEPAFDGAGGGGGDTDAGLPGLEETLVPQSGAVDVGPDKIPSVPPPYLAYNQTTGAARLVEEGADSVLLDAASGDVVCVARVDDTRRTGTASCWTLR